MQQRVTKESIQRFVECMASVNWSTVRKDIEENNPYEAYNKFLNIYTEKYNINFPETPKCSARRSPKQPWMTDGFYSILFTYLYM